VKCHKCHKPKNATNEEKPIRVGCRVVENPQSTQTTQNPRIKEIHRSYGLFRLTQIR
jgi:cytochrome c peroxidase